MSLVDPMLKRADASTSDVEVWRDLVASLAPASVLINAQLECVCAPDRSRRYMKKTRSNSTLALVDMVRPELRIALRELLHRAIELGETTLADPVTIRLDGTWRNVSLWVRPHTDVHPSTHLLVVFIEGRATIEEPRKASDVTGAFGIREHYMNEKLRLQEAHRREAARRHAATLAALRAANDELVRVEASLLAADHDQKRWLVWMGRKLRSPLAAISQGLQALGQEARAGREGVPAQLPRTRSASPVAKHPRSSPELTRRRILVVDDCPDVAEPFGALLRVIGQEVEVAYSGGDALSTATDFKPEIAFLDLGMPGMDGLEVARRLRQQSEAGSLVLVALTGYGHSDDIKASREAGFDHHLRKPIRLKTARELLQALET